MIKLISILFIGIIILFLVRKVNLREKIFGYYASCYTDQEYSGDAAMGCCGGMNGKACINCPYFTDVN